MTDEKLISGFLNKNYKVGIKDDSFIILSIHDKTEYSINKFAIIITKIFGKNNYLSHYKPMDMFFSWLYKKKSLKCKRLYEFFDSMDGRKGSKDLLAEATHEFIQTTEYNISFVTRQLNDFYTEKLLITKLNKFLASLTITLGRRNWEVNTLIDNTLLTPESLFKYYKDENNVQQNYIFNAFNDWYYTKIIELSQKEMNITD